MHRLFNMTRTKELQKVSLKLIREVGDVFSGVLKRYVSGERLYLRARNTCLTNQEGISHMRFCLGMTLETVFVSALLFTDLYVS